MTKTLILMAAHAHPDDQEVALLGYHDSRMPGRDYGGWR